MRIYCLLILLLVTLFPSLTSAQTKSIPDQKIATEWKKGQDAMSNSDYKTAKLAFDKVIALGAEDSAAYFNRGYAQLMIAHGGDPDLKSFIEGVEPEQLDPVIADFSKAIQLSPNDAEAYYFRGICYKSQGNWPNAIADSEKAASLDSDYRELANAMQGSRLQHHYYVAALVSGGLICAVMFIPFIKAISNVMKAEKAGRA